MKRDDRVTPHLFHIILCGLLVAVGAPPLAAQPPAAASPQAPVTRTERPPQFVSPEVTADRQLTFRLFGPRAQAVRLNAGDIPGLNATTSALIKAENGVWEVTVGPVPAGAYRYTFNVDGVSTTDPRNPATSESNNNAWSLVVVPGSDLFDTKNVRHGAVAEVNYNSTTLGRFRRMHVYTPPGYEKDNASYPVFYLLHGAGDSDDAWTTVGRANAILDNLIAAGKARPMIVVMPAGHTSRTGGSDVVGRNATEEFAKEFTTDLVPYVESHYRVLKGRSNMAIAGLSMGGQQALYIAIPHLDKFGYIGVYSSGLFGAFPEPSSRRGDAAAAPTSVATAPAPAPAATPPAPSALSAADWAKLHAATLDNPALKKGLRVFWFATGKDDRLITTTQATVDLFKKHGFTPEFHESDGAHTWLNWRDYLATFAPRLFR